MRVGNLSVFIDLAGMVHFYRIDIFIISIFLLYLTLNLSLTSHPSRAPPFTLPPSRHNLPQKPPKTPLLLLDSLLKIQPQILLQQPPSLYMRLLQSHQSDKSYQMPTVGEDQLADII